MIRLLLVLLPCAALANSPASTARWVMREAGWGTVTAANGQDLFERDGSDPSSLAAYVLPFASYEERVFLYLMGERRVHGSSLISQASLDSSLFHVAGCGSSESAADAEDPRCAKLTLEGSIHPCEDQECIDVGQQALFTKHPVMKNFPVDHNFKVHEFHLDSLWMIASYGGGSNMTPQDYIDATPTVHEIKGGDKVSPADIPDADKIVPDHSDLPARARWIVRHSLWTTVSTSSGENGGTFSNVRSVTDRDGTGLPYFYLPDVDPTHAGINEDIVLTFTEASLAQRVTADGQTCGGQDAGMPTCAQITLRGKAAPVEELEPVLRDFADSHPLAPWLAEGGSHMSGKYYTMELDQVHILDYFGGVQVLSVEDYLSYKHPPSGIPGEHGDYEHQGEHGDFHHHGGEHGGEHGEFHHHGGEHGGHRGDHREHTMPSQDAGPCNAGNDYFVLMLTFLIGVLTGILPGALSMMKRTKISYKRVQAEVELKETHHTIA